MSGWRLEERRTNGELVASPRGTEYGLRELAVRSAAQHGQKSWRFDLYEGGALKATYKRGVWTEHGERKA